MCGTGKSAGVRTGDKDSGYAITHPKPTAANRLPADDGSALAASEKVFLMPKRRECGGTEWIRDR